jgi:acetylornithine/succinyldiaminopimelate/putrescine aminotransferase
MIAVDFHDAEINFKMLHSLLEKGIFSDWFLWCNTALRIAPPLILSEEDLEEIEVVIKSCSKN